MKHFAPKFVILFLSLVLVCQAKAANIDHVNVGRIKVEDQSLKSQQLAGKLALAQVFIKLSGNPQVLNAPQIEKAIDNFEQFLIASSFIQINSELILEATFNQQKIENLLMASGLSVWASLRPSGSLWLGLENQNDKQYVLYQNQDGLNNDNYELSKLIEMQAYARGVDVILPIGDLQDTRNVSVYDVWNQFISHLYDHNLRYNSDYLISATLQPYSIDEHQDLIARNAARDLEYKQTKAITGEATQEDISLDDDSSLSREPVLTNPINTSPTTLQNVEVTQELQYEVAIEDQIPLDTAFKIDYVITNKRQVYTGSIYASTEQAAVQQLVDSYANMLAKQFALSNSTQTDNILPVTLTVNNIDSLGDYVALMQLLGSVPAVTEVSLVRQNKEQSIFSVQQNISSVQLRSILALDPRLRIENNRATDQSLTFSWQE